MFNLDPVSLENVPPDPCPEWAWSTRRPKADIKGGVGGEAPHESGRPKADSKGWCGGAKPPHKFFHHDRVHPPSKG